VDSLVFPWRFLAGLPIFWPTSSRKDRKNKHMERNLCHEVSCPDLCCENKWNGFTLQELQTSFPKAIHLPRDEDVRYLDRGVYVLGEETNNGLYLVYIKGRCPNNIGGCRASQKPQVCRNHPFEGAECRDYRKRAKIL